jgi:poly(3-hydroxyalkanoate) synthetase
MLWLGCGGSIRENPVPNLDCDSAQATWEVRLTPNFANHLVMLIKYGLHQKSHIPGLLLSQPPLEKYRMFDETSAKSTVCLMKNTVCLMNHLRKIPDV